MAVSSRQNAGLLVILVLLTLCPPALCAAVPAPPPAAPDPFPVYPEIKANMNFWIDIFTRYSKTQGVVHHTRDLSKVFDIIPLDPARTGAAAQKNRRNVKTRLKSWKTALINASKGKCPDPEKRKIIQTLFGINPAPKALERAAFSLRVQTGLKEQFKEGLIRSGAMVPGFKKIFKNHDLPEDLAFLPCVESSFNVNAYSKFGAAGVWQFTRGTGKRYMEIGYVVDERRDPFTASRAAAKLLKRNHEALKDWSLAITAYNHGLNGMKRAKKRHGSYPAIYTHYRSRAFKFASRNFYSEFLAARHVAKHHKTYFGDIRMARPVRHTRITTRGFLSAAELGQKLEIDLATLRQMNPSLRPPVFDGRKYIPRDFELRLPGTISRAGAQKVLAGLYRKKQKPSRFHRVQKGDTAGKIAMIHGVSLKDLIMANGLNRRATIYVGQNLRIPSIQDSLVAQVSLTSSKARHRTSPETVPNEPVIQNPEKRQPPSLPVDEKISQPAVSPPPAAPKSPEVLRMVTADLKVTGQGQEKNRAAGIIQVAPEETLGHYADWLGIATQKIRALNRMPFGKAISVGQQIKIPLARGAFATFEEKRYEFHQEILEDFFGSFFITGSETYEIKAGDTLWDLCLNTLEIPLWLLEKYNSGMNLHALRPGQRLNYPLVSARGDSPEGT